MVTKEQTDRLLDCLLETMKHGDDFDRLEAAKALLEVDDPRVGPALVNLLETSPAPDSRRDAAWALGFCGFRGAVAVLIAALRNTEEGLDVRCHAVEAIGHLLNLRRGQHEVRAVLRETLQDESAELRFWAAFALGNLGIKEDIPSLCRLVDTDHRMVEGWWTVSKEASDAIAHINERSQWRRPQSTNLA